MLPIPLLGLQSRDPPTIEYENRVLRHAQEPSPDSGLVVLRAGTVRHSHDHRCLLRHAPPLTSTVPPLQSETPSVPLSSLRLVLTRVGAGFLLFQLNRLKELRQRKRVHVRGRRQRSRVGALVGGFEIRSFRGRCALVISFVPRGKNSGDEKSAWIQFSRDERLLSIYHVLVLRE